MTADARLDLLALLRPPHDALLLRRLAQRLKWLATQKETPERRAEIDIALALPWWGLRGLAIAALGAWGGPANRAWLTERARRPVPLRSPKAERWAAAETLACRRAVAPHCDAADADWLLDLWFADYPDDRGIDGPLARLPEPIMRARLQRELASPQVRRVKAAIWLTLRAKSLPDRGAILERLSQVPWQDGSLRREALHAKNLFDHYQKQAPSGAGGGR